MADEQSVLYVVDDDPQARDSLADLCQAVGHRVATFSSAESFLESVDPTGPACLVLDVRMPGMSGMELLRELRRRDARLPVIIITGHGDVQMAVDALKLGASEFIEKPYRAQTMLDSIAGCIHADRRRRAHERERERLAERLDRLTARERQITLRLAAGATPKRIASELDLSHHTVQNHRQRVMEKTGSESVVELTLLMLKAGSDEERLTIIGVATLPQ